MEMKDDGVRALSFKIGLKLWSKNIEVLSQVRVMYERSVFDYIELYIEPETMEDYGVLWHDLKIDMIIHAPHFGHGFNLADEGLSGCNFKVFQEVAHFADLLKADTIIVHGGNGGAKRETIRQLKTLKDSRLLIENKPNMGLNGKECIGYLPEDIAEIVDECGLSGFVLDFNHAVCAANSLVLSPDVVLKSFLSLSPVMFHLSDGTLDMIHDVHLNFGKGNFDLSKLIAMIPAGKKITFETPRSPERGFQDFADDVQFLEALIGKEYSS